MSALAALMGSLSTIVCCFLPAVFVLLGMGATFAGLVGAFPQIVWLSEHKALVFGLGGVLLGLSGYFQWRAEQTACPIDPVLAQHCKTTKGWSHKMFFVSLGLYFLGFLFAFVIPRFF